MAHVDEKVMKVVESALEKTPSMPVDELYELAREANEEIGELNMRQFNARYPLQIKRRKAREMGGGTHRGRGAGTGRRRRRASEAARDGVRETFLDFATAIAAAQNRKELVTVLASVDGYVEKALKAASAR